MGFTVDIDTTAVKGKFDDAKDKMAAVMSNELNRFAVLAVQDSKLFASLNHHEQIRQAIHFEASTPDTLRVEIAVSLFYAAYIEFGTGIFAASYVPSLPQNWQKLARTFFVSGKGRTPNKPFLFPAIEINIERLKERLK